MNAFVLNAETVNAIDASVKLAISQDKSLSSKAKPIAEAIISQPEDERPAMCRAVFDRVRGPYVAAKTQGAKAQATALGKAWKRVREMIDHHLKGSDLRITWPNWATGVGDPSVESREDYKSRRAVERADQEAADAAALQAFQDEQEQLRIEAVKTLGPEDFAKKLASDLREWSSDPDSRVAAVRSLIAELGLTSKTMGMSY